MTYFERDTVVRLTFTVCITISNSTGHAIVQETTDCLTTDEMLFAESSLQALEQKFSELKFSAIINLLFSTDLHITTKYLTDSPLAKTLTGLRQILKQIVLLILLLLMERFVKRSKNNRFITAQYTYRFTNALKILHLKQQTLLLTTINNEIEKIMK